MFLCVLSKIRIFKSFGLVVAFASLIILGGLALSPHPVVKAATTYEVGPGKPYSQLKQVATLLQPGDTVNVYANGTTPYKGVEFKVPGTSVAPITIHGVRDANGRRPILSDNGLISGAANIVVAFEAGYYIFEGFEVTTTSTNPNQGAVVAFNPWNGPSNTTRDIAIKDTYLHDCPSFGFLSNDSTSGSMLFSHVEVARCGGGLYYHSIYLTTGDEDAALANSVVQIEYSYVHESKGGNDVKLRSKFNKIYYNWLETQPTGGYYDLQLIGPDDGSGGSIANPRNSEVVGNVFIQNDTYSAVQIGGDGTGESFGQYRFVNNTFVVNGAAAPVVGVRFQIKSLEFENNVFANFASGGVKVFIESDGPNWLNTPRPLTGKANWVAAGSIVPSEFQATVVGATNDPGFVSLAGLNLRPQTGSSLINQGTSTPVNPPGYTFPLPFTLPAFEPPSRQIKQTVDNRTVTGPIDIGAYEANIPAVPTVSLSFNPISFYAGGATQIIYSLTNPNSASLSGVAFSHNLPSQLKIAANPGLTNSCGGGTVTATPNSSVVSLSGLTLTANQTCSIKLQITSNSLGNYNTATNAISSTESGSGLASNSASVQVKAQYPSVTLSFSPTLVLSGTTTTLTYTLSNPNPLGLTSVAFSDILPPQLQVANPPAITNTCGGTPLATAGTSQLNLSGASLGANANCVVAVSLTSQQLGTWLDQLESLGATESGTTTNFSTSAAVQVIAPLYIAAGIGPGNSFRLGATKPNTQKIASLQITNGGHSATTLTLGLGAIPLSGVNAAQFTITNQNSFPLAITGGQSQAINLGCMPTTTGTITATLNLLTNNLNQPNTALSYTLYCAGGYVVTKNNDDGSDGTLSEALANKAVMPGDAVVFELSAGNIITLSTGITLSVKPDVTLDGGCTNGSGVTLDGTGTSGDGLKLEGLNFINGLKVQNFLGHQLVAASAGNQLKCVIATKN